MNYTFKNQLGLGGMATVYLAEDKKFQTDVAVKVLNKEFAYNQNIRKRFLAEARNMFKMSHLNIVRVTDMIEEDDTVAFVMEYIEGKTLKDYLEDKGKLSDKEITNLFAQMLEAVGYVHEQNLVHRDIKPSNFMLSNKGVIKLMDFGIAKNLDPTSAEHTVTGTNQIMGTPLYMSPEQVKSTKDVTPQSDIYSLGVVLWQMVTGEKPYDSSITSTYEIQSKIVNKPLPLTNTKWDKLIQNCTQKETSIRFKSIGEVIESLKTNRSNNSKKEESKSEATVFEEQPPTGMPKSESTVIEEKVKKGKTSDENSLDLVCKKLKRLTFAEKIRIDKITNDLKEKNGIDFEPSSFYATYFIPNKSIRYQWFVPFVGFIVLAYLGIWVILASYIDGYWYGHWTLKVIYTIVLGYLAYISYLIKLYYFYYKWNINKVNKVINIIKKFYE